MSWQQTGGATFELLVLCIDWTITIGNIFLYSVSLLEVSMFGSYPLKIILKTRLTIMNSVMTGLIVP